MKKILILFLILSSCKPDKDINNQMIGIVKMHLSLSKKLLISSNPPISSTYQIFKIYNDSLFFGLNPFVNPNELSVFDLKSEIFVKNINIDLNLFKSDIMNFYVHNPDSIFFYSYLTKHIYLIDYNGTQIDNWDLDNATGKEYPGENGFFFPFNAYNKFIYLESDKTLVIPISDNHFYNEIGDSSLPKILLFNIEKDSITDFIAPPFGRLRNRNKLFFPNDIINPQIVELDGSLFISYPFDDEIAVFDIKTGKAGEFKNPLVNLGLPLFEPKDSEFLSIREKSWNYRVEMPFFENLSYHEEIGLFSRIYHYPYNQELDTEKNFLRKSCIVYFTRDLDFAGKIEFEEGKIGVFRSTGLKDGYLIGESDNLILSEDIFGHNKIYKFN